MNIFFDLDGTLIDARHRVYQLFQYLVPQSELTFDSYWELKRDKISHKQILQKQFGYSESAFAGFEKIWLSKIEEAQWLTLDKPFEGVSEYLDSVMIDNDLYVVTARQSKEALLVQLDNFGWTNKFKGVLVANGGVDKWELIERTILVKKTDWMVGDTGKDIQSGKRLGIRTAAVLSGFLSRKSLSDYHPDLIVNSVVEINFL